MLQKFDSLRKETCNIVEHFIASIFDIVFKFGFRQMNECKWHNIQVLNFSTNWPNLNNTFTKLPKSI